MAMIYNIMPHDCNSTYRPGVAILQIGDLMGSDAYVDCFVHGGEGMMTVKHRLFNGRSGPEYKSNMPPKLDRSCLGTTGTINW